MTVVETDSPYRQQIERFTMLFAQSPSFAAVLAGPEYIVFLANPTFERLVGGRAVIGRPIGEAIPELIGQNFHQTLGNAFESGVAQVGRDVALTLKGRDGALDTRRVDIVYQPVKDLEGRLTAIFIEGTDVTERFEAAEMLRGTEQRNRQILDSAIDFAIIATDLEGRVTRWNRGAELTLGWNEAEMLGRTVDEFFTPEDRANGQIEKEMSGALQKGRGTDERWHLRKSGERFWASGEMTPLRDDQGAATGFVKILRDRTTEHQVSEALRASEERLRRAQEAGGVGVFAVGIDDGVVDTSPEFCRIFGLEPCERTPAVDLEALILPEDGRKASDEVRRRTGDLVLATEYRIRRANDGEVRTIARRAEFERDDAGQNLRMLGVVQDVTEQRLTQAAVVESEARFRAFTEAVPNQVWSARRNGRLDWANQRTLDYGGHPLDHLTKNGWEEQVHPEDLDSAAQSWAHSIRTGDGYSIEFRLRRFDGEFRWHIARAVALRDEGGLIERWIGTNTDIHEARLARDELAELNATLEQRVDERTRERDRAWKNSRDLQVVLDSDGIVRAVNDAWGDVLDWNPEDIVGRNYAEFVHPDDQHASKGALEHARCAPLPSFENRYLHRDGGWRWISWVAAPEGGSIYASGRHVTAEREAAAALESTQDQLRQAQKMEAVGQLTGGVAHDFNNLLTVIRGSVDLLRRSDLTAERRARYVDAIGDTADRAAKLTGQLLAFARRQALKPELFDAANSLSEVAGMLRTLTGSRIVMNVELPQERCLILADRSQFDTAIINMGINARDAMRGEGTLRISTGPVSGIPPVRGHAAAPGDFVAVAVHDDGAGIAPSDIDRIFEPFFTTKAVGEGTGLGLSQVIGFAKQSGGDIRVESAVNLGTTFTLYLPRAPSGHQEIADDGEIEPIDGEGVRVLVVEDNAQVGEFATNALGELGYETVLATDGRTALEKLADAGHGFQIVFSDVVMPGMSGMELSEEIRRRGHDVPVVLTSGYSHVLSQNGTHGFDLLHKPYSIEQLSRTLQTAVARFADRNRKPSQIEATAASEAPLPL